MVKLEKLKELLLTGILLSKETFLIDDVGVLLDNREIDAFDNEWIRNYNAINKKKTETSTEVNKLVELIREIAFKIVYNTIQSSDLAGYISDDFGLIAEALIENYNDSWLNALAKEYVEKRIPHNTLKPLEGELYTILTTN